MFKGYNNRTIETAYDKVKTVDIESILEYKSKDKTSKESTWSYLHGPVLWKAPSVIHNNRSLITRDPKLKKVFPYQLSWHIEDI